MSGGLRRYPHHQSGSVHAYRNVGFAPFFAAPPAMTATYCLPFFPIQVIGFALTITLRSVDQSSIPLFSSKALNLPSAAAPMNTSPPAVAIGPPLFKGVPVFGTPNLSSSWNDPNGT